MKYLELINEVDNVPSDFDYSTLYKFLLPDDARPHGFMLSETVAKMPWAPDFEIDHESRTVQLTDVSNGKDTSVSCNSAFQKTIDSAIELDLFELLHGQHSEYYKILGARSPSQLERFAAPLFGIATRGAHMTAYTRASSGEIKIWVPRRSAHLFTYPNKLDTTVAGGVKAQHTPFQCIVEESAEEASLSAEYVKENAKPVGVITYMSRGRKSGLIHPDVIYLYDLELPLDMKPHPQDDEVSEFILMSIEEIQQAMKGQEFKPNCSLVMIDFFLRHGIITPEVEPDYIEIMTRLHRALPVPTNPGSS